MQTEELTTLITSWAPNQKPGVSKQYPEFILDRNELHFVAQQLKENPKTKMDYLFCLTAVDRKDGCVFFRLAQLNTFYRAAAYA